MPALKIVFSQSAAVAILNFALYHVSDSMYWWLRNVCTQFFDFLNRLFNFYLSWNTVVAPIFLKFVIDLSLLFAIGLKHYKEVINQSCSVYSHTLL